MFFLIKNPPPRFLADTAGALQWRDIGLELDPAGLEVSVDPLFERVFHGGVGNTQRYCGPARTAFKKFSAMQGKNLVVIVEDNGSGIDAGDKKYRFTRGFSTHTVCRVFGLGLFLPKEIHSITGMRITETGKSGFGSRFGMVVPDRMYRFVK